MRKVNILQWKRLESGALEKASGEVGYFHEWGTDFEEFESGPAQFTVAIVEKKDGSVVMVAADMIQFID